MMKNNSLKKMVYLPVILYLVFALFRFYFCGYSSYMINHMLIIGLTLFGVAYIINNTGNFFVTIAMLLLGIHTGLVALDATYERLIVFVLIDVYYLFMYYKTLVAKGELKSFFNKETIISFFLEEINE